MNPAAPVINQFEEWLPGREEESGAEGIAKGVGGRRSEVGGRRFCRRSVVGGRSFRNVGGRRLLTGGWNEERAGILEHRTQHFSNGSVHCSQFLVIPISDVATVPGEIQRRIGFGALTL